jgi:hypothetical protein
MAYDAPDTVLAHNDIQHGHGASPARGCRNNDRGLLFEPQLSPDIFAMKDRHLKRGVVSFRIERNYGILGQ